MIRPQWAFKGADKGLRVLSRRMVAICVRKRTLEPFSELNFDSDAVLHDHNLLTERQAPSILSAQSSLRRTTGASAKIIENKNLEVSIEEETLLELMKDLSPTPVPAAHVPYVEYKDLGVGYTLPPEPQNFTAANINKYVAKLVSQSYHPNVQGSVVSKLMRLVKNHPKWLSKESYVGIVSLLHFLLKSNLAFEVLDIMHEEGDIVQDVDFMNAFIMSQNGHNILRYRVKRLESFRDRKRTINVNTYYYLFNLFQSPGSKLKLLNMMIDYDVPLGPIMNKSLLNLTDALEPEELTELYSQCNVKMDPFFFNTVVRSFLFANRVDDAWLLVKNSLKTNLVTVETYKTFIEHFARQNNLALCFAFNNLWTRITETSNEYTLKSFLLNQYLTECPYFAAWSRIVKICRINDSATNKKKAYVNVSKRANWAIHDYAIVHNVPEPSVGMGKDAMLLRDLINRDLVWENEPVFCVEDNTPNFKEAAQHLGWVQN